MLHSNTLCASQLQWGKPSREPLPEVATNDWESASANRDPAVVEAAWEDDAWEGNDWEEDDTSTLAGPSLGDSSTRSVVVKRSEPADLNHENPLEREPRIAQRPDDLFDPFEEPEGEPLIDLPADEEPAIEPARPELELDDPVRDPVFEETLERDPLEIDSDIDLRTPPQMPDTTIRPFQRPIEEQLAEEIEESQQSCEAEIAALEADTIDTIDLSIRLEGTPGHDYPYECRLSVGQYQPRDWQGITYNWKASALCHKPLYFEQAQLERHGHTLRPCVQPIVSGAHFFGSIFILPYKMGITTPNECIYTLGHYRPGSCAPHMIEAMPFTWRAAMFQTGAVTATAFIVP